MKTMIKVGEVIGATFITAFAILLLVLVACNVASAQTVKLTAAPAGPMFGIATLSATVSNGPVWDLRGTGINSHKIQWSTIGTVSGGACKLQGAATFSMASPSDIISAQTVTSNGGPTVAASSAAVNYIQMTCSTPITGTGSVVVYYTGTNDTSVNSAISASVTNSVNVKASPGSVYGFSIANGAATVCYAQFINSAGAGTLGTGVVFAIALPGSSVVNFPPDWYSLGNFSAGIAVGIATTPNTNSACGTAGNVTTFYK